MEQNPYQAPTAVVSDMAMDDAALAGRGARLGAAFIDGIIMLCLVLPVMFATGYFAAARAGTVGIGTLLGYATLGFVIFVIVQGHPLKSTAQTWGKRVVGIRIVHLDGTQPTIGTLLFKRYLPIQAVGIVPVLGSIAQIVDTLMIFRSDKRCGHDLIAGTKVVNG
jgi:uncharacterized RDD family membrane protein YckC